HGTRPEEIPRNLGGPVLSTRGRASPYRAGREGGRWYRATSSRECRGKEAGSRSAPVVPKKRGNHPEGPCGGKGRAGSGNRRRERWRRDRALQPSQRNKSG